MHLESSTVITRLIAIHIFCEIQLNSRNSRNMFRWWWPASQLEQLTNSNNHATHATYATLLTQFTQLVQVPSCHQPVPSTNWDNHATHATPATPLTQFTQLRIMQLTQLMQLNSRNLFRWWWPVSQPVPSINWEELAGDTDSWQAQIYPARDVYFCFIWSV